MKKNSSRGHEVEVLASFDTLKGLVPNFSGVVLAVEGWIFVSPRAMLAVSLPV